MTARTLIFRSPIRGNTKKIYQAIRGVGEEQQQAKLGVCIPGEGVVTGIVRAVSDPIKRLNGYLILSKNAKYVKMTGLSACFLIEL